MKLHGRMVIESIDSAVLRGNALGDPATREVPVYLPPSYDSAAARRYPVLYILTGFTGRALMYLNVESFGPTVPERIDAMIVNGTMRECIVVFPDCFTRLGGSQYVNSTATGRYEDHVIDEVIPAIDARFRTLATRDNRGIIGKSSGGYGAVWLGLRHAEVFGAVGSHSGDMYFEYCYRPDMPAAIDGLQKAGGVEAWFAQFEAAPKKTNEHHKVLNILAMAACYSPDPAQPLGIALPFDLPSGEWREDIWRRWLEFDPAMTLDAHGDGLRSLRYLFLDCGVRDEFNLHLGARLMAQRLRARRIAHEHLEFDDGHMGVSYRYDVTLPKMAAALAG